MVPCQGTFGGELANNKTSGRRRDRSGSRRCSMNSGSGGGGGGGAGGCAAAGISRPASRSRSGAGAGEWAARTSWCRD